MAGELKAARSFALAGMATGGREITAAMRMQANKLALALYLFSEANRRAIMPRLSRIEGALGKMNTLELRNKKVKFVYKPTKDYIEVINQGGANRPQGYCLTGGEAQDSPLEFDVNVRHRHDGKVHQFSECIEMSEYDKYPQGDLIALYKAKSGAFGEFLAEKIAEFDLELIAKIFNQFMYDVAHDGHPYIGSVACAKEYGDCIDIPLLTPNTEFKNSQINLKGNAFLRQLLRDTGIDENLVAFGGSNIEQLLDVYKSTVAPDSSGRKSFSDLPFSFQYDQQVALEGICSVMIKPGAFIPLVGPAGSVLPYSTEHQIRNTITLQFSGATVEIVYNFDPASCDEIPTIKFQLKAVYDLFKEFNCEWTKDSKLQYFTGAFKMQVTCEEENMCKPITPCATALLPQPVSSLTPYCPPVDLAIACGDKCRVNASQSAKAGYLYAYKTGSLPNISHVDFGVLSEDLSVSYNATDLAQVQALGVELQTILGASVTVISANLNYITIFSPTQVVDAFFTDAVGTQAGFLREHIPDTLITLTANATPTAAATSYTLDWSIGALVLAAAVPTTVPITAGVYGTYGKLYIAKTEAGVLTGDGIALTLLDSTTCTAQWSGSVQ